MPAPGRAGLPQQMQAGPGPPSLHHPGRGPGPAQGFLRAGGGGGGEEEINTASSGQRHGGSPFPGTPGKEEPPARPRAFPSRPGALGARQRPGSSSYRRGCTGGWAAACAVPAKPRRSRSQSGPAPPRLLLVSPSLPGPAFSSHSPAFLLPARPAVRVRGSPSQAARHGGGGRAGG